MVKESVIECLSKVYDPEIPVNIVDLGLVYQVYDENSADSPELRDVSIVMTLTAPGCPVAGEIISNVRKEVLTIAGVGRVTVELAFNPPWIKAMMSEEAKFGLGFFY